MKMHASQQSSTTIRQLELGCGSNKRDGFFGIDILSTPCVDLVMDYENNRLPFEDDSIDYVYSSHSFEHIKRHPEVFRELLRVCRHDATIEIWTPYGKSDDGLLFGHYTFFSETSFKHICYEYDRFYLGDSHGYFLWERTHYNLYPGILEELRGMHIPLNFALTHMFNVALEWGVFLRVKKDSPRAPGLQYPLREYSVAGRAPLVDVESVPTRAV
ncbi:methyltransferase domain-containing protein [Dyella dinghuensis]|uniref:Methyltransferase domain-containing protein n=1 Tax=Dyella dinghuensis TaxID=1920169 RepID=A0A432LTR5_9GAMM|nr:methyltransferase domain-containing protein [Dyella dinghuensis]RUL64289.1 methyltransferase domain-containing protein [Dyella dinghuensis]